MPDLFVSSEPTPLPVSKGSSSSAPKAGSMPFFATLSRNPVGVSYADQDKDETIVLFLRRHGITNLGWIITAVVLLLLPLTSLIFPGLLSSVPLEMPVLIIGMGLYYLLVFGFVLYQLVSWFYNISLVTDKKVIDVDYHSLTAKDVAATTLDAVEDIKYQQPGVFKTQWNFGNVEILTQAAGSEIIFEDVPRPSEVVDIVLDLKRKITEP